MIERNLNIRINEKEVLRQIDCPKESVVYAEVAEEYKEIESKVYALCEPVLLLEYGTYENKPVLMVLYSIGKGVSEFTTKCFQEGDYLKGVLSNAMADSALFSIENELVPCLKTFCKELKMGISRRLEAPRDIPMSVQKIIFEKTKAQERCGMKISSGYMLDPVKSNAVLYELVVDQNMFHCQHDCRNCRRCFRGDEHFAVVSDYEQSAGKTEAKQDGDYGIAIDIGTTTIAIQLVDLKDGKVVNTYTAINRQRHYGVDVISRIHASTNGKKEELRLCIQKDLRQGIKSVVCETKVYPEHIKEIVIAGNTTMIHLLMGYDCKGLGEYPFTPTNIQLIETQYGDILKDDFLHARVRILPGISAFVGGDIVSGLYAAGIDQEEGYSLFIDLGTNGEMALGNQNRILVTSTAAGPAFEGGNIACGVGSIEGAISGVEIKEGKVKVETIGDKAPVGICGTGVIEAVAELCKAGLLDMTGCLEEDCFETGYVLAKTPEGADIILTQQDIREIQLAKAAVRAGLETLLLRYGIQKEEVTQVYLAGGFGFRLNCQKAIAIGMLPEELQEKIKIGGNSSLNGAVKCLFNPEGWKRVPEIVQKSEEINLSADKDFNRFYMESMYFE